ncbi:MAG: hypothetical protein WBW72_01845 [Erwinia billingiae]|jgi:hypothetical protein
MFTAKYYYASSGDLSQWEIHRRNCERIMPKTRIFLGTLYTDHQALMVARQRVPAADYCRLCTGSETGD